jgi:hypothetical protein
MRSIIRIADVIDRGYRGFWWYVLELIGVGVIAWAAYRDYGPWWGVGVVAAGVLSMVAVGARMIQKRRAQRAVTEAAVALDLVRYPPWESWPVVTLQEPEAPAAPPPADRFDEWVIIWALQGSPVDRRLISLREMVALAVHEQLSDRHIAQMLRCSLVDVAMLLAIAQPKAAMRR